VIARRLRERMAVAGVAAVPLGELIVG